MTCSIRSVASLLLVLGAVASAAPAARGGPAFERFTAAQAAYNLGRFDEALAAYSESYQLKPHHELLFNIAQCHRQLAHFAEAAFFYRRFLSLSPKPPKNAALVEQLIREMDEKLAAQQERARREEAAAAAAEEARTNAALVPVAPTPPPVVVPASAVETAPAAQEGRPVYKQWWFWTIAAVVVAGAGAATAYGVSAQNANPGPAGSLSTIDARK